MQFQNPWGALAFLLLVPLILLYLLRQRHEEVQVPSIALWDKVVTQWQASHPWQKWRRSLLFFLQLAAVCLLAFALMRPVWRTAGMGQNSIVIVDLSMSMQAVEGGRSRLDRAREEAKGLVSQMQREEHMSLIFSGLRNELLLRQSRDKDAHLRLLDSAEAGSGGSQLEDALLVANSLRSDDSDAIIHIYTDWDFPIQNEYTMVHNVALGAENVAITSVNYSRGSSDGSLYILGLLHNFGGAKTVNVELWADGALVDVREVKMEADSAANVMFEELPSSLRYVSLAVSDDDALAADNRAYCVVQDSGGYKVLLMTERNIFLEKAILLRDDIELYKTVPSGDFPVPGDYDLLIGDGWSSRELPEDQDVWIIDPGVSNEWFTTRQASVGSIRVGTAGEAETLLRHVDLTELRVAAVTGLATAEEDTASTVVAYMDSQPLILLQEQFGHKRLAFGFDFHESNLPLQKDFPILVQNILEWFLPLREGGTDQIYVGSQAAVALHSDAASYSVRLPDGSERVGLTARQFDETGQPGFYNISQHDPAGEVIAGSSFAANPLVLEESELRTAPAGESDQSWLSEMWRRYNLWPYVILLALVIMSLEWWVYHRGS